MRNYFLDVSSEWQTLKINVDGAFKSEDGSSGIGVVVSDEFGECVAAMTHYFSHVNSAIYPYGS